MNTVAWLFVTGVVGSIVGCIANIAVRAEGTQPVTVNILVGACGAIVGASVLSADFGTSLSSQGGIPLGAFGASCLGAAASVGIVLYFWRGRRT